ncbi:MAG: hypothetical protein V8Q01_09345 [Acutalibacteraceae bacterium]
MNEKIAWLNRLDKQIKLEIMDAREGAPAFAGYTEKTPDTQELLVPSPYETNFIYITCSPKCCITPVTSTDTAL